MVSVSPDIAEVWVKTLETALELAAAWSSFQQSTLSGRRLPSSKVVMDDRKRCQKTGQTAGQKAPLRLKVLPRRLFCRQPCIQSTA